MIIYNGKESLKDFDLYVASKDIPPPQRKTITETVPYMSGIWDFSFNEGVDEYEPLPLKYTFDVIADTKQELNSIKAELLDWLHNIGSDNEDIRKRLYDTDISETEYYEVYFVNTGWSEEGLQGLLTAEFVCYPFRKTESRTITHTINNSLSLNLENAGYRPIYPIITVSEAVTISDGINSFSISAGTYTDFLQLKKGSNALTITGSGSISITLWEERL